MLQLARTHYPTDNNTEDIYGTVSPRHTISTPLMGLVRTWLYLS